MDIIISILFIWCLLWIIGILISKIFRRGIRLPFLKKCYKDNKSPIYKLEIYSSYNNNEYVINKYELNWSFRDEGYWFDYIFVIPLIFESYMYVCNPNSFGKFSKKDIENNNIPENLEKYWESSYFDTKMEHHADINRQNNFRDKLKNINKEFYENYK